MAPQTSLSLKTVRRVKIAPLGRLTGLLLEYGQSVLRLRRDTACMSFLAPLRPAKERQHI